MEKRVWCMAVLFLATLALLVVVGIGRPSFLLVDAPAVTPDLPAFSKLSSSDSASSVSSVGSDLSAVSSAAEKPVSSAKTSSAAKQEVKHKTSKPARPASTPEIPIPSAVKPTPAAKGIVNYLKRATYASNQKEIKALQEEYPQLITVGSIGRSTQGRDLTIMKVGKGDKKACIIAGIHAREGLSVSWLMRCVETYCRAYQKSQKVNGYDIRSLLDTYTLYVVPLSNPDGLEIIGGRAKPNVTVAYPEDTTMTDYKGNANGVNLNKNFPLLWDKIDNQVTGPDVEGYKGIAAASEPETRALMALCENNDFLFMTSVHVRGDCIYWSDKTCPSVGCSEEIALRLKNDFGFYKCKTSDDPNGYGGGFENWFRKQYNRPGFCLEIVPLTVTIHPENDNNHRYFDYTTRWETTRGVLPMMLETALK